MEVGDKVYIRNKVGKLTVELVKQLDLRSVFTGVGDDKLQTIARPRLEFHNGKHGEQLITLCDRDDKLPGTMYVAFWESYCTPEIWVGKYENDEEDEDVYETVSYN